MLATKYTTRPPRALASVATWHFGHIGRRLAVAVRAKHPQVLETVVIPGAIDVIEVHVERLSQPLVQAANLALVLQQLRFQEPHFDVPPTSLGRREQLRDRHSRFARYDLTTFYSLGPCLGAEAKMNGRLTIAVPGIVICLHFAPIILPSPIAKPRGRGF